MSETTTALACPHCGKDFTGDEAGYQAHTDYLIWSASQLCKGLPGHDWKPDPPIGLSCWYRCDACGRGKLWDTSD